MNRTQHKIQDMEQCVGGPGYRWKLAQHRAFEQRSIWEQHLDEPSKQAVAYLRIYEQVGEQRANQKYPATAAACNLFRNEQAFQTLKLSVLGNIPRVETAARLGTDQEVIEIAEALFFDIRDMREATSWMNSHVFMPEVKAGNINLAVKMKLAFYGGAVITRALFEGEENLPLDEAHRIVDQETLLYAKLQAALQMELDAASAGEYVKNYLEYDLARRQLQLDREKFQFTCEQAREQRAGEFFPSTDNTVPAENLREDSTDSDGKDGQHYVDSMKSTNYVA